MPKPRGDGGYILPVEIDPPRRCVQLQIPDDDNHIRAFWGALDELAHWYTWQRDELKQGRLAAAVWKDVLQQAYELFLSDDPCPCEDDDMSECCDAILAKLDEILAALRLTRADPAATLELRGQIELIMRGEGYTPTDLHPSAPDVSFTEGTGDDPGDLDFRRTALCHTLWLTITAIKQNWYDTVAVSGVQVAIDLALTGWWVPSALAFIGTGLALVGIDAALGDEGAIKNLICCMVDELAGLDLTQENIITAARTCEIGGNETLIGEALANRFTDLATFGAFVHDLGQAFDITSLGGGLYCVCDDELGETCEQSGTVTGIDLDLDGSPGGLEIDANLGSCPGFGTIVGGGADWEGATPFCMHTWELRRFFGGTTSNEALYARVTINGATYYQEIVSGQHCIVTITPHQVVGPGHPVRVDLIGGGEKMCMTSMRFTGVSIPT